MRIIVFQHIAVEHPGIFRDFMNKDGIQWDVVELDEGESIPKLDDYDAIMCMGGPMDVWQEDRYPWLIDEKSAIRHAINDLGLPYLGFCLGHQLLADSLGGTVGPMQTAEIGVLPVELTNEGIHDCIFSKMPGSFNGLQWHGAEIIEPPPGGIVLARSPASSVQALRLGRSAYSIQCHIEITNSTVFEWGQIPEYEMSLTNTAGPGALSQLDAEAKQHMGEFNRTARSIYDNFISCIESNNYLSSIPGNNEGQKINANWPNRVEPQI